ncbi:MAG: hypothetical protein ACREL7_16810 [Longimicrobiales bacterium]
MNGTTTAETELHQPALRSSEGIAQAGRLRGMLLWILCFGMLGTGVELILLEHTEDVWQWVPLVLLGMGVVSGLALAGFASKATVAAFRIIMVLFIAAGLAGLYLHYTGNVEFELEMYPAMDGLELFWNALRGATPALAPGAMALFGLIGLTLTYAHPATRAGRP